MGNIIAALCAFLGEIFADEFKAWLPWVTERVIRAAVCILPPDARARCSEEWRADLNEIPGPLGRFVWALGLVWAAFKIFDDQAYVSLFDRLAALLIIVVTGPTFLLIGLLIKLNSPGPVLRTRTVRFGERVVKVRCFRTISYDPKKVGVYASLCWHELRMTPISASEEEQVKRMFYANPPFTWIGRLLFYSEIDLLPALFDVVRGHIPL